MVEDVRQISGYARDVNILQHLAFSEDFTPPCLIIYPERMSDKDKLINNFADDSLLETAIKVKQFNKLYKLSVALTKLKQNATSSIQNG